MLIRLFDAVLHWITGPQPNAKIICPYIYHLGFGGAMDLPVPSAIHSKNGLLEIYRGWEETGDWEDI